jgi:hypothetical protein
MSTFVGGRHEATEFILRQSSKYAHHDIHIMKQCSDVPTMTSSIPNAKINQRVYRCSAKRCGAKFIVMDTQEKNQVRVMIQREHKNIQYTKTDSSEYGLCMIDVILDVEWNFALHIDSKLIIFAFMFAADAAVLTRLPKKQETHPCRTSKTISCNISHFSKPQNHIFKLYHFSGTQLRFIIRHFALNSNHDMTPLEWRCLIGPSPCVRNAIKRLFKENSEQNIRQHFEHVFGVQVVI